MREEQGWGGSRERTGSSDGNEAKEASVGGPSKLEVVRSLPTLSDLLEGVEGPGLAAKAPALSSLYDGSLSSCRIRFGRGGLFSSSSTSSSRTEAEGVSAQP